MKKVNTKAGTALKRNTFLHEVSNNKILLLMITPAILYFLIFQYIPMFGVILAFKKYDYALGILKSEWIGFKNFEFFYL